MFSHKIFKLLAFTALSGLTLAQGNAVVNNQTTPALNITAIDGVNGSSVLQCWRLDDFAVSNTPGTEGALNLYLGNISNASYTIIPARTNAGLHRAPAAQFVFFASGLIHLSLPNSTDEAWLQGGKYGLIFAADTADKSTYGHATEYPSDEATVSLQVPLEAGTELNHTVLHEGACTWAEQAGL